MSTFFSLIFAQAYCYMFGDKLCAHVTQQLSLRKVIVTTICCKAAGESKSMGIAVAKCHHAPANTQAMANLF